MAEGSLTARPTSQADAKAGHSDLDGGGWHLDVGSSYPGGVVASKGWAVRPLKLARELGSERRETVRSLSVVGAGKLRGAILSTRGPSSYVRKG